VSGNTLITKFFAADQLKNYGKGSFKIGTLSEYRNSESSSARMADTGEGITERRSPLSSGIMKSYRTLDGLVFSGNIWENCGSGFVASSVINEYIFCATFGDYSKDTHKKLLYGCQLSEGHWYSGNPDLTHFAVINVEKFILALRLWIKSRRRSFKKNFDPIGDIGGYQVVYRERFEELHQPIVKYDELENFDKIYLQSVFFKPPHFLPENEFRISMNVHQDGLPPEDALPLFPCSLGLKNSIVRFGQVKKSNR